MKLITKELANKIPKLYETESLSIHDKMAVVKLFTPNSGWTWYIIEFDGEDTCFGFVEGADREYGYFNLSELEELKSPHQVERDKYFEPTPISKVILDGMSERG
jgi:hypothetical protein